MKYSKIEFIYPALVLCATFGHVISPQRFPELAPHTERKIIQEEPLPRWRFEGRERDGGSCWDGKGPINMSEIVEVPGATETSPRRRRERAPDRKVKPEGLTR